MICRCLVLSFLLWTIRVILNMASNGNLETQEEWRSTLHLSLLGVILHFKSYASLGRFSFSLSPLQSMGCSRSVTGRKPHRNYFIQYSSCLFIAESDQVQDETTHQIVRKLPENLQKTISIYLLPRMHPDQK